MSSVARAFAHSQVVYPEFKNILFATDFSQCSAAALNCLHTIAQSHGSTVRVVHVVPPDQDEAAPLPGHSKRQTIKAKMADFLEDNPLTNVPYEVWVARGPIAETLLGLVQCEHIELVGLGMRGHGHRAPRLGSVAGQVLLESPCPVLTVGEPMRARGAERLGRILYVTDFSPASLRALPYALSLAKEKDSHLMLLYVDTREVTCDWLVEAAYEQKLLDLLPRDATQLCSVEPIVEIGAVANGIVEAAALNDADVIVMGAPRALPLFSTEIYARAHCPVLSVA
jgi:nucleotide-binding universal stress UspA family protein